MTEQITFAGWAPLNPKKPQLGFLVEVETAQDHIWWYTNPHLTEEAAEELACKLEAQGTFDPDDAQHWHLHGFVSNYNLFMGIRKAS